MADRGNGTHGQWGTYLTSFWQLNIFVHYLNHLSPSQAFFKNKVYFSLISLFSIQNRKTRLCEIFSTDQPTRDKRKEQLGLSVTFKPSIFSFQICSKALDSLCRKCGRTLWNVTTFYHQNLCLFWNSTPDSNWPRRWQTMKCNWKVSLTSLMIRTQNHGL